MARQRLPERKTTMLRLPPELYAAVEAVAAAEDRSVNAQLNVAIREWLRGRKAAGRRGVGRGE
jgi:hypothetical protein